MTAQEFSRLEVGDLVKEIFNQETNELFKVININRSLGKIIYVPLYDETDTFRTRYINLAIVEKPLSEELQIKKQQILDVFMEFRKDHCKNCPFKKECDNTYAETRAHSTSPINICDALRKTEIFY